MRPIAALLLVGSSSLVFAQTKFEGIEAITQDRLRAHLELVAHDLLEGRDTPSRGQDIAALYVATQLRLWGAKPGGDKGTFLQEFELPGMNGARSRNVVAIAPGSDPVLAKEFIAIGSHIDHVGLGDGPGDRIYNGADDDGSGIVAMLEMAHAALKGPRPKRSLLFVWHTGEEKGLWGSEHFTKNPTVPIGSIVAQLNIDMIGRSKAKGDAKESNKMLTDENSIYVVGSRRLSKELGTIIDHVNRDLYGLRYDYHYDAPNDPENIYMRSDHYNYAVKGIPVAFWFDGVHEDYHQAGDHADKIDYKKLERVSRTIYATAWTLANRPARPKVGS